jgi:hypothetical protein
MKIKQKPRAIYDATDLEHLRQMVATRGWQMITERISDMIATELATCASSESVDAIRKAQGALAALGRVVELPEILDRELRARTKS